MQPSPVPAAGAPDRWLQKSAVDPVERLPLFAEAMGAVAEAWTEAFCALSASEGVFAFKRLRTTRVGDVPARRDSLPIFAALRIPAWGAVAGLSLDRDLVSTVVDALFGGSEEAPSSATRPVSPIEMRIVDVIGGQSATALTAGLRTLLPVRVEFERTWPKPEATFLGKPPVPLLAVAFALTTLGRTVEFEVLLPMAAIEAHSAIWAGDTDAPVIPDEATWTRQLQGEIARASLRVEAEIAIPPLSLRAIADLRVGQVLELPADAGSNVLLRSRDERLFRCHLGQSSGFYTVRVDEAIERDPQPSRKGR